jgi:hypothetical protein
MSMRTNRFLLNIHWTGPALLAAAFLAALGAAPLAERKVWDFEKGGPGRLAKGFSAEVGTWEVAKDGDNRVLSVKVKAVAGELDQGGGLVWRAKDKNNYYVARFNPLEDNYRVYKVEAGKRTQFASAKAPNDLKWHTLRVTMAGSKIASYLDGEKLLEADDATFPGPGMIGLWSKADAQTYFDDLTATE